MLVILMLFSSPSEYRAQKMTVDFLNALPERTSGEEMADRLFALGREMASRRVKPEDFNLSCTIIRQTLGITDEVWAAMVQRMNARIPKGPIIISGES